MTSSKSVIDVIRISISSNPVVLLTVELISKRRFQTHTHTHTHTHIYIYIYIYIYVYWSNPHRLLVIAFFMNKQWRHQFRPEITIEKGCWNFIAVLPCEETKRYQICSFGLTSLSAMKCVGVSNYFHVCKVSERLRKCYSHLHLLFTKVMFYIYIQLNQNRE